MKLFKSKYYDNINDISLNRYILIVNSKDLRFLLKKGIYNKAEAKEAWLTIIDQYNKAIKSKSINHIEQLMKIIGDMSGRLLIINNCLFMINEIHLANISAEFIKFTDKISFEKYVNTLAKYGYRFDQNKPVFDEIIRIKRQVKNLENQLKTKEDEFKLLRAENSPSDFEKTLSAVEKYMGFQIDQKNTTLKQFIEYLNLLISTQNGKSDKKG